LRNLIYNLEITELDLVMGLFNKAATKLVVASTPEGMYVGRKEGEEGEREEG
jgi:hypothetical protein